jgi:hypothetical protein
VEAPTVTSAPVPGTPHALAAEPAPAVEAEVLASSKKVA